MPGTAAPFHPQESTVSSPRGEAAAELAPRPPPRILVVDDESSVRRVCTFTLRAEGWRAEPEESPAEALRRLLGGETFDVLVLDFAMPGMNGLELLRELERARGTEGAPPVLLASAHADGATAAEALRLGVWDFLAKPLTPEDLRRRVRRLLDRPLAAARGEPRARALLAARRRAWAEAYRVIEAGRAEADELIRGLLAELCGEPVRAAAHFRHAHWAPAWRAQGAEIWPELAKRLDV